MSRVRTLAALSAALLSGAGQARAAHLETPSARAVVSARGVNTVTALSIVPSDGRADVIVAVSGPVSVQDFTVPTPHRIVLDITGARLAPLGKTYDRVPRAGVTNIRVSQYRTDVVRIVLDLEAPRAYTVESSGGSIRVSLVAAESFAAWHSAGAPMVAAIPAPVAPRAESTEPAPATTSIATGAVVDTEPPSVAADSSDDVVMDSIADVALPVNAVMTPASNTPRLNIPPRLFSQQSQQPRITVTYQDAEIRDVLAAFAAFSGRTIIAGKDVKGTVTAEIKDQPWDVALRAILEAQGLAANEETSGIITVDSYENILQKQASEPLATRMISVNYVGAASLVDIVKGLLSRDCPLGATGGQTGDQGAPGASQCMVRGNVAADSATNSLLVTEVASRMNELLEYIKQLDVRTPQVALKAKIISVSRSDIEQLGISYDLGTNGTYFNTLLPRPRPGQDNTVDDREGRVTLGGDALAGIANASRRYKNGSALNLLFSTALGNFSLTSFIDALREYSLSDIQAEPSVVTLDNREARILVGQETPVRVIDAGSAGVIGAPVRANVQFKETGIILTVTPHITNNRQIRMTIVAEQSELRIIGGDLGFFIDKRNARTQLLVNDGETAVIGGLTQTQIVRNRSGIPFLTDLPLLGRLFSQYDSREEKKDLLILITPHIIDEGEAVRPPGSSQQ